MVSADVADSMNEILPREHNLLPVAFKRKIEYKGHYVQEYVDRKKLQIYFKWFQQHNHLFKNMKLEADLIDKFEKEAQNSVEEIDIGKDKLMTAHGTIKSKISHINDELYNSDEEDKLNDVTLEKEIILNDNSST